MIGELRPELSGATVIQAASELGIPIGTTHAIASAIVGAGAARRFSVVRWGVTFDSLLSWVLTVSYTILLGALAMLVLGAVLELPQ